MPRRPRIATGGIAFHVLKLPEDGEPFDILSQWPMERPKDWIEFINDSERESELEDLRSSAQRGRPFGIEDWMIKIAKRLGLESTPHSGGRPND